VVYANQWGRWVPAELFPVIQGIKPEHRIFLNGIEYVRIYNIKMFPKQRFRKLP
jgi:hypothetical protein